MKVWLVTIGEPLPIGGVNVRLLRAGLLAEKLISRGHQVLWWTSTFDHSKKQHLFLTDRKIDLSESFCLYLLHACAYKKNISLQRILNHMGVANKFRRYSRVEEAPEVILCSMPILELGLEAVRYGNRQNIPVILDLRDMWPDIFMNVVPKNYRWFLKKLLTPLFSKMRTACQGATAITGITQGYVEWGLQYAERARIRLDKDFPMGYSSKPPVPEMIKEAESFWKKLDVYADNKEFVICLFSSMVRQFELETVLSAARHLSKTGKRFRFVLCGRGEALEYFKKIAKGCDNVLFPGWVDKAEIWTLMRIAQAGLAPYRSTEDFVISIPNKVIEYMSAGLPIISSLRGTVQELLSQHEIGLTYENENVDSLYHILCDLYDNPEKLKIMSINSQILFKERFDAERVYTDMCDYLEDIAKIRKESLQ